MGHAWPARTKPPGAILMCEATAGAEVVDRMETGAEEEGRVAMVEHFKQVTGVSDDTTCRGMLEAYGWDVGLAASAHFEDAHGGMQSPARAEPMGVHRPPERLVDPPLLMDEEYDEDEDYQPPPRRLPSSVRPMDDGEDDDADGDHATRMRSALFPGGFAAGIAAARAAVAANGPDSRHLSYMPAGGVPSEDDQLQKILVESAQLYAGRNRGAAGIEGNAQDTGSEFESVLARSQQVHRRAAMAWSCASSTPA